MIEELMLFSRRNQAPVQSGTLLSPLQQQDVESHGEYLSCATPMIDSAFIPVFLLSRWFYLSAQSSSYQPMKNVENLRYVALSGASIELLVVLFHFSLRLSLFVSESGFFCLKRNLFLISTHNGKTDQVDPFEILGEYLLLSAFSLLANYGGYVSLNASDVLVKDTAAVDYIGAESLCFVLLYSGLWLSKLACCEAPDESGVVEARFA